MVAAHKDPPAKPEKERGLKVNLEHVGDGIRAEACVDLASYRSDHGDLSNFDDPQVRGLDQMS